MSAAQVLPCRRETLSIAFVLIAVGFGISQGPPCKAQEAMEEPAVTEEEQFGLEVLDAIAFGPTKTPGIIDEPTAAVDPRYRRTGVFADGASVLIIRLIPVNWPGGAVTFRVRHATLDDQISYGHGAEIIGSLSTNFPALPAPDIGPETGSTITTANGTDKLVYYRPPNNFTFGCASRAHRLKFTASHGVRELASAEVELVRPSIVLNHGLASGPEAMERARRALTTRGRNARAFCLDYKRYNTSGYDVTTRVLAWTITREMVRMNWEKVAATRLDIFGHSMGGVIVKWYASELGELTLQRGNGFPPLEWHGDDYKYRGNWTFGVGDIRRLVSVGSPFQGSPIGDEVSAALGTALGYEGVKLVLRNHPGANGDGCAIEDLGVGSSATERLISKHPTISWYPIVGIGEPFRTEGDLTGSFASFLLGQIGLAPHNVGLLPTNSDFVVLNLSQVDRPGLPFPPPNRQHALVRNLTHNDETRSGFVRLQVHEALDMRYSDPSDFGYEPGYLRFNGGF